MDYFEVTAVIDEEKVKAKNLTVTAVMTAIDRVAADVGMPKIDSGVANIAKYRIDMDISTSLASAGRLINIIYEPWTRQYLSSLTLYNTEEDELEDVFAEIDGYYAKYGD